MEHDPQNVEVGYYAVGLIDILNQRQELAKWNDLEQFHGGGLEQALSSTVGVVRSVREMFSKCVEFNSRPDPDALKVAAVMTPDHASKFLEMERGRLGCQQFADTSVLFAPANLIDGVSSFKEVWAMISGAAIIMQVWLAQGVAIRGGIEFGAGCELDRGEVYGPVLAAAYRLEHELAQWPRILIGRDLHGFLTRVSRMTSRTFDHIAIDTARLCLDRIVRCDDGQYMVDFFHRKMGGGNDDTERVARFKSALSFVTNEMDKFNRCRHSPELRCECKKLADRYGELHKYLMSRARYWT